MLYSQIKDLKSHVSYSEDIRTVMKRDLFGEQTLVSYLMNSAQCKCEQYGWKTVWWMVEKEGSASSVWFIVHLSVLNLWRWKEAGLYHNKTTQQCIFSSFIIILMQKTKGYYGLLVLVAFGEAGQTNALIIGVFGLVTMHVFKSRSCVSITNWAYYGIVNIYNICKILVGRVDILCLPSTDTRSSVCLCAVS